MFTHFDAEKSQNRQLGSGPWRLPWLSQTAAPTAISILSAHVIWARARAICEDARQLETARALKWEPGEIRGTENCQWIRTGNLQAVSGSRLGHEIGIRKSVSSEPNQGQCAVKSTRSHCPPSNWESLFLSSFSTVDLWLEKGGQEMMGLGRKTVTRTRVVTSGSLTDCPVVDWAMENKGNVQTWFTVLTTPRYFWWPEKSGWLEIWTENIYFF